MGYGCTLFFFSIGTVQCPYSVVDCRPFPTDATMFCLGLVFPIVPGIYLSRPAIVSSVGHAFDCVYEVCPFCQPRDPPVVFHSDDMSSPCPFRLVKTKTGVSQESLLSPILFRMYINGLTTINHILKLISTLMPQPYI